MDDAYRLLNQQTASGYATIAYDSRGNIASKWHQGTSPMTFTVVAANRLVTMLQGTSLTTYAYDDNGNLISEALFRSSSNYSFTYDDEDRMILENQVNVAPNGRTTNTYTGDGLRRTTKAIDGTLTTFIWDGSDYLGEY